MDKSPDAFRTISEVADALETPAHVLRFWESRFPQIKPVKRAGGRRYYRPADVALLGGIRHLLHDEGMTIRGVQKILREQGVRHVAAMAAGSEDIDFDADLLDGEDEDFVMAVPGADPLPSEPSQVVALEPVRRATLPPSAPAEVVQLRAVPEPAEVKPAPEPEEVPEAGHIWVEDEPEMDLVSPTPLFPDRSGTIESEPLTPEPLTGPAPRVTDPGHVVSGQTQDLSEGFVVSGGLRLSPSSQGIAMTRDTQRPDAALQMTLPDLVEMPPDPSDSVIESADSGDAGDVVMADVDLAAPDAAVRAEPAAPDAPFRDSAPAPVEPALSGLAGRLRALPRPVSDIAAPALTELHSRLGLLLAQMAEAQHQKK